MTLFAQEAASLSPSAYIELFELDTTSLGGAIYTWTPGVLNAAPVSFGGVTYQPMPVESEGWEYSAQGKLPRPKIRVSNVSGLATGLAIAFNNLLGAKVTRIQTFQRFLDGQPEANASMMATPDIFFVNRKTAHNKHLIEWELASEQDQQGLKLPRRQALRDTCGLIYRQWNVQVQAWTYGDCPYTGDTKFKEDGSPATDPLDDVCSHQFTTGCKRRFGDAPLPMDAFPGMAIVRV